MLNILKNTFYVIDKMEKPEASEIEAIKLFCAAEVQKRNASQAMKTQISKLRAIVSEKRTSLIEYMKSIQDDSNCAAISRSDALRLDKASNDLGLKTMPRYLRLLKTNKDSNITTEIIQEALQGISVEDIRENMSNENMSDAKKTFKDVILQSFRRLIRSYTTSLKLVNSALRGLTLYDLPECPMLVADNMWALWNAEQEIKDLLANKPKNDHPELKERIENYFVRTGLSSQRIVVESRPWRLVRKVSIQKMRIGIGRIENMLDDALKNQSFERFNASEVIHFLQVQISSLPPETKTSVGLCAVKE